MKWVEIQLRFGFVQAKVIISGAQIRKGSKLTVIKCKTGRSEFQTRYFRVYYMRETNRE